MKEKIYTIPINEAVDLNSECAFCEIEKKLEKDATEYALGAAMMEPDYRILCNEKGFCNHHFSMLFKKPNKLSLALILDSRLETLRKDFSSLDKSFENTQKKCRFFKKSQTPTSFNLPKNSCVICEKIDSEIKRYTEVFFYMWKNDQAFKEKILSSKGFCLPHFYHLLDASSKYLSKPDDFIKPIYEKQISELKRIQDDIHRFTLKFDYRNKDMDWKNAKDAPIRTIEKTVGYIDTEEQES